MAVSLFLSQVKASNDITALRRTLALGLNEFLFPFLLFLFSTYTNMLYILLIYFFIACHPH